MSPDGTRICFEDLAIARGYAQAAEARYMIEVSDGRGNLIARYEQEAGGPSACIPIGDADPGATGYRVVSVRTHLISAAGHEGNHVTRASRIHLRWREDGGRFVVVGLERDE